MSCQRCGLAFDPDRGEGADGYCQRCHYARNWGALAGGAARPMMREGLVDGLHQSTAPASTSAVRYLAPNRRTFRAGLRADD